MKLTIGVIGAGGNTKLRHIPGLLKIKGVTIKTVVNRTIASAKKVCKEFGIQNASDNVNDIFMDPSIDGVVIGTWPNTHKEFILRALKAGKHVLCEARMAMNLKEAQEIEKTSKKHKHLVTQIVPAPFTLGDDEFITKTVKSKLGKLKCINCTVSSGDFPRIIDKMSWREDKAISGENILSMGIFYETITRWVGEAKTVRAIGNIFSTPKKKDLLLKIPDHLQLAGEMESGASYSYVITNSLGGLVQKDIVLYGDKGSLKIDFIRSSIELLINKKSGKSTWKKLKKLSPKWRVEEEYINAILGKEKVRYTSIDDAMKYMIFTDRVNKSLSTGKVLNL